MNLHPQILDIINPLYSNLRISDLDPALSLDNYTFLELTRPGTHPTHQKRNPRKNTRFNSTNTDTKETCSRYL